MGPWKRLLQPPCCNHCSSVAPPAAATIPAPPIVAIAANDLPMNVRRESCVPLDRLEEAPPGSPAAAGAGGLACPDRGTCACISSPSPCRAACDESSHWGSVG